MVPLFPAPGWAAQKEDEEEDEEASAQRLLKGLAWTAWSHNQIDRQVSTFLGVSWFRPSTGDWTGRNLTNGRDTKYQIKHAGFHAELVFEYALRWSLKKSCDIVTIWNPTALHGW